MLHKFVIGVVATTACLLSAEDALGQYYYVNPSPGWSVVSQSQPSYWYSPYFGGGGYYSTYYSGTVTLPGWDAKGYAPRMRATLEPAVSMQEAASTSGVAAAALTPAAIAGERDSIRPASNSYQALIPRSVDTAVGVTYGTYSYPATRIYPAASYGCCGNAFYGYR